jgi:membrane protease subunit (stomatin/prohibitin family)
MPTIDRIKFDSPSDEILVWKFPTDELKLGSQLIVHPTQEAIFVKGGEAFDLFTNGTHTLSTGNLPLLGRVINLPFGGQTPFTAEVWFINKTVKRDLKWGTQTPILLIDPEYNFPVSVRSYGRWGLRIAESRTFLMQLVGTLGLFDSTKVWEYFAGEIHQRFSNIIANYFADRSVSVFSVNTKLNVLSETCFTEIAPVLAAYGIELINFNVERVSIPEEEVEKFQQVLGRRMEIDQISKSKVGPAYTTMRSFDTLEKAASNPSGGIGAMLASGVGLGAGLGAGVSVGRHIGDVLSVKPDPTMVETGCQDAVIRLQHLKQMLDLQLITQQEFDAKKKEILDGL